MSDSDISVSQMLIKYKENGQVHYMHKDVNGNIIGLPKRKGALMFTPRQAINFINLTKSNGFPFQCAPEPVK